MRLGHNDPWVESHIVMWMQEDRHFGWNQVYCRYKKWVIVQVSVFTFLLTKQDQKQRNTKEIWAQNCFSHKMTKMHLRPSCSTDLNRHGVKGHLGVSDLCFKILKKRVSVSTYFDVFLWDFDTMILGLSYTCNLNRHGVKGHLGVNDLWFKFLKKGSLYLHTLMYFCGTWIQRSFGRIKHVTLTVKTWGFKVMVGSMTFGSSFWKKKGSV